MDYIYGYDYGIILRKPLWYQLLLCIPLLWPFTKSIELSIIQFDDYGAPLHGTHTNFRVLRFLHKYPLMFSYALITEGKKVGRCSAYLRSSDIRTYHVADIPPTYVRMWRNYQCEIDFKKVLKHD